MIHNSLTILLVLYLLLMLKIKEEVILLSVSLFMSNTSDGELSVMTLMVNNKTGSNLLPLLNLVMNLVL